MDLASPASSTGRVVVKRTMVFVFLAVIGFAYPAYDAIATWMEPRGAVESDLFAASGIHFLKSDRILRYSREFGFVDRSDFWKLKIADADRYARIRYSIGTRASQQDAQMVERQKTFGFNDSKRAPWWWPRNGQIFNSGNQSIIFDNPEQVLNVYSWTD
jgi:hypothetical protein